MASVQNAHVICGDPRRIWQIQVHWRHPLATVVWQPIDWCRRHWTTV